MTIPKKGSRIIAVDDITYRWMVTGNDLVINVIVELEGAKGQKLLSKFDYHQEKSTGKMISQKRKVTPEVIKKLILYALELGWEPNVQGKSGFVINGELVAPMSNE